MHATSAIDALGLEGDELTGAAIVRRALEEPLRQIAGNAGFEGGVVVARVRESALGQGFDAERGEYGDLAERGIIDPVKVTKAALVNAVSIATMVLTTESAVVDKPDELPQAGEYDGSSHGHAHGGHAGHSAAGHHHH